jgi:drug/metabolite transporter (DMT)-like permease
MEGGGKGRGGGASRIAGTARIALTGFALVMFAANSILGRMVLEGGRLDPTSFTVIRMGSGALTLGLLVLWGPSRSAFQLPRAGDWSSALWLVLYALPFAFAYLGLGAGMGALILFGAVQVTMLLAALRGGERLSVGQWGGLVVALAGLGTLVAPGLTAPAPLDAALMALAGMAWGLYSLRGRGTGDPLVRTAGNFLRTLPLLLPPLLFFLPDQRITGVGVGLAMLSGSLASAVGYAAWYAVLPSLSAARASTLQLAVPVLAALGGVLLLAEPITPRLAGASALVLGGVWLTVVRRPV